MTGPGGAAGGAGGCADPLAMRRAGPALLSVGLLDARNALLSAFAAFESRGALDTAGPHGRPCARRQVAEAAAWPEYWIARHLQRGRGEHCEPSALRLPPADAAFSAWTAGDPHAAPPAAPALRAHLAATLEQTLDLLAALPEGADDDALHFFRAALRHEDRLVQSLAECAAALQLPADGEPPWTLPVPQPRAQREPLVLPGGPFLLGSPRDGGSVPESERWSHPVTLPPFEIDAQPVSWQRYVEFAEDGGYDRPELWTDAGRAWLATVGRRAPRDAEQLRGAPVLQRQGRLQRASATAAVAHVTRLEAQAWCRWAGRRLPTEAEWECAAVRAGSAGFAWGDVFEWVLGRAAPWPGHAAGPGALDTVPPEGADAGVLRGASVHTPPRLRHPRARRFLAPPRDDACSGFRSVAA